MRKIILACFIFFSLGVYSQNLSVSDLYIIKGNTDINQINYFLVKYKNFEYVGHIGIDEQGWDNYKFSKDGNELTIGLASGNKDGQFYELTSLQYMVYSKDEYDAFINSLILNGFIKGEKNYTDGGIPFVVWSGTKTIKDMLRLVSIFDEKNGHVINAD